MAIGGGPRLMRHGVAGQGTGAGEGAAARHPAREPTGQPRATRPPTLSLSLSLSREATEAVAAAGESAARAARAEAAERYQVPLGAGPMRGPADARVTILEFVDYQCPFTARAEAALARVLARYRDHVRFQVIHRPLPFHPQAESLARAALAAAEQGRFWQLHGALMAAGVLERWTPERLERVAREIGLDPRRFQQDLDGARVRGRAEVDEATASSVRVEGTPVFFVNGRALVGADAPAHMPAVIEEELARADTLAACGAEGAAALYNAAIAGGKPVLSELPPLPKGPAPRPSNTPRFERLFQEAMSCGPVLDAPAALDLSFQRPAGQQGGKIAWPWSLTAAGGERYGRRMRRGDGSFSLASTTAAPDDFVAHHQTVTADGHQGERVRFTAEVRGENIETWAGIWIRAIGRDGRVLTSARTPLRTGGPDGGWHPALVELVLPSDAKAYSFGFVLAGRGTASMRKLALESSTP